MRARPILSFLALAALIMAGLWFCSPRTSRPGRPNPPEISSPAAQSSPNGPHGSAPDLGHPPNEEPSHLADGLNSVAGDIHADLRIVDEIFRQYRSAIHGLNPVGENAEIVAVLTGRNRLKFAFIPRDNPAINAKGELCDRWGTPFFFHQLSGTQMEIHSAGPDKVMWTADDEVLTPGLYLPQR